MKINLLAVTLLSVLGGSCVVASEQPTDKYLYLVALFDGDVELHSHAYFITEANQFSTGVHVPYLVTKCDRKGSDIANNPTFYKGVGYYIDVETSTLKFVETVIDESSYSKPTKSELEQCIITGQPTEREYKYIAKFDLNNPEVQKFSFDNNRVGKIIVQKQD